MAITARPTSPVCLVFDARQCASVAGRVFKLRMTAQAKLPAGVDSQRLNTAWMIYAGSMTIFALDRRMDCAVDLLRIFGMALSAVVSALVLDGEVLPFLKIAEAVIAVGEVSSMDPKVVRNHELPGEQDQYERSDRHPQWVQYVPLHFRLPQSPIGTQ